MQGNSFIRKKGGVRPVIFLNNDQFSRGSDRTAKLLVTREIVSQQVDVCSGWVNCVDSDSILMGRGKINKKTKN